VRRTRRTFPLPFTELEFIPVGIVTRVSTEQQVERVSLQQQDEACRRLAAEMERDMGGVPLRIVDTYQDAGVSGDGRYREELFRAIRDIESGRIRLLLAYDVDRLSRDPGHLAEVLKACQGHMAQFYFCQTHMEWNDRGVLSQSSLMMYYMKGAMGASDLRGIVERMNRGRLGSVDKGKQTQRGHDPFGYHIHQHWEVPAGRCTAEEVGTYALVPEQAKVVETIFKLIGEERKTLTSVCRYLMDEARVPAPGKDADGGPRWTWYQSTIRDIVADSLYKGEAVYGRRYRPIGQTKQFKTDPKDWKILPAPPCVSPELWEAANHALATNRSLYSDRSERKYLWSGFLRCPLCGASMIGLRSGKGGKDFYYVCCRVRDTYKQSAEEQQRMPKCKCSLARAAMIESRASESLTKVLQQPEVVAEAVRAYIKRIAEMAQQNGVEQQRASLIARRDKAARLLSATQEALMMAIADGVGDVATLRERQRKTAVEKAEIDAQLSALAPAVRKIGDVLPDPKEVAAHVTSLIGMLPSVLESDAVSLLEKRLLLSKLIERAVPIQGEKNKYGAIDWGVELSVIVPTSPLASGVGLDWNTHHSDDDDSFPSPRSARSRAGRVFSDAGSGAGARSYALRPGAAAQTGQATDTVTIRLIVRNTTEEGVTCRVVAPSSAVSGKGGVR